MSARHLLPCTCGKEIPVEQSQAGQLVRCECGREHEVPTLQKLRGLKRSDAPPPTSPAPSAAPSRRWGRRHRLVVVGGVLILLAALVGLYLYGRQPMMTVEDLRPWSSVQVWYQFRDGLHGRLPTERAFEEALESHQRWVYVAIALGIFGGLTMLSALFVSSRPDRRRPPRPAGSPTAKPPADLTAQQRAARKHSRPRPN